jgi:serine/threonine protein kinase
MEPDQRPPGMLEGCRILDASSLQHITEASVLEDGKQYILCMSSSDFEAILRKHGLPVPGGGGSNGNGAAGHQSNGARDERQSIAMTDQLESLEELSYYFDDAGTLRHCATNHAVHEIMSDESRAGEIDEIVKAAIFHVQMEMLAELNFKQAHLPLDLRADEPKEVRSSVFLTSDWKTNDNLLIVINGGRGVQPGIWSRDLLIQEGLELGSMLPVFQRAQGHGFSVAVLNPFTNNVTVDGENYQIRHNSTPDEHTLYVWDNIISRSLARNVYVLAYSFGAKLVTTLLQKREAQAVQKLKGIVFAEGAYRIDPSSMSPMVGQFLRQRAINFKADADVAMGHHIPHVEEQLSCNCLSVGDLKASADPSLSRKGSSNKARTISLCQDMTFKYFVAVRDRGNAASQFIAECNSKSRSLFGSKIRSRLESITTPSKGRRMSNMPDGPPLKTVKRKDSRDSMAGTSAMRASTLSAGSGSGHHAVSVSDFDLIKVIGKGSIGKVFLVRKVDTHVIYAMKVIRKMNVVRSGLEESIKTERLILEEIDHPFIARLRFSFQTKDKLYLVTDFCSGGELFQHMNGSFSYDLALFYAAELVLALEHLHSRKVAYRDLKPENILLEASGHLRITDFGLSKQDVVADDGARTMVGSTEYMAPEVLAMQKYGYAVDWWSLGVFIYEMLVGDHPFADDTQNGQIMKRNAMTPGFVKQKIPAGMAPEAASLIVGLLEFNQSKRLGSRGAQEVRSHPFFAAIEWDKLMRREVRPPWRPSVRSESDVQNFDPEFTSEPVVDSVMTHQSMGLSTTFENFTFDPSKASSMRQR